MSRLSLLRLIPIWLTVCVVVAEAAETAVSGMGPFVHTYERGCVAADHPLASEAGAQMLRQGGNVVDAAVATAFALSVVRPESCGLGGGGFMVMWDAAKRQGVAVDYREQAPLAATRNMFRPLSGHAADPSLSRRGGLAVAVTGEVAGLCHILERFGTLELKTVITPAIRLAREGFAVDATLAAAQREVLQDLTRREGDVARFAPLVSLYLNNGQPQQVGERFHSPLAKVLELIAEQGPDAFYEGPIAEAVTEAVQRQGGVLTLEDFEIVSPTYCAPLAATLDEYQLIAMPPPSSGGVALVETLNILSAYEQRHPRDSLAKLGQNSPPAVHLVTEAMKHVFADRAEFLGDTDFVDIPVTRLLSRPHAERLAEKIDPEHTLPSGEYGRFAPVEDGGTSHFCVIDREGNAVACTGTINTQFGSYVVEPTYGIVLNNEMDDFAAVPGQPNAFGLIQSEANAVAPGKTPLSSMSPTILVKDGKAVIVLGGSGGPRIISGTLQVLLNLIRFDLTVEDAVRSPRFHHQWLPDTLFVEPELLPALKTPLERRGHDVTVREELGVVQAAVRSEERVTGMCDPRKGGRPAGY